MPLIPTGIALRGLAAGSAPTVAPEWVERTLVFRLPSGGVLAADGYWYATLAVHPSVEDIEDDGPPIVVTHVPTKLAIFRLDEPACAYACAEKLWSLCGRDLSAPNREVDLRSIPQGVIAWVRECNRQRKFVEYEEHKP